MRDYDKELADSLDKSDQIAKLEAKVEELQRQLAEREAVIEKLREALDEIVDSGLLNGSYRLHDKVSDIAHKALAIPTDHTSLDEAIKQAKVEVLESAMFRVGVPSLAAQLLLRMADEIRSKT